MPKFIYISKEFKTLKQVERFEKVLLGKYNHVLLLRFPLGGESGIYQFEVR